MKQVKFFIIVFISSLFLIGSNCGLRGCGKASEFYDENNSFVFKNNDLEDITIRVKKFNTYIPNTLEKNYLYKIQVYPGEILNIPGLSEKNLTYIFELDVEPNYVLYHGGVNNITLEIFDKWQTVKYADVNLNFTNYGKSIQITKSAFWDADLNFNKTEYKLIDEDNYIVTRIYSTTFSRANFPIFASELKNFRLWNNFNKNISVKIYKVSSIYGENYSYDYNYGIFFDMNGEQEYNVTFFPSWYNSSYSSYYNKLYTPTEFENIFWQTSATWESEINSGGVGTIFHSTLAYTGPYKIEIYDKATKEKLLEDKVRYPIFDEEELLKYKDSTNPFADGMRIRTKLEWYKKSEVPSSMLNISTISGYPNEFYAEYRGY